MAQSDSSPSEGKKKQGNPILGGIVLLVIIGAIASSCGGDDDTSSDDGDNDGMAKVMCENFIEDRLKSPASAEFSGIFDTTITGSGNEYTVTGTVDSQNSFGAMIRSNYVCQVRDDGNDSWSLVSLTGLN